jgi:hypothetical protein
MFESMNDQEFDDLLRTATDPVPLPPSFQQEVWRRIESRADADAPRGITWVRAGLACRANPWWAAAGMAATVTLGAWLGAVTAPQAKDSKLVYAESISPFASTHRK